MLSLVFSSRHMRRMTRLARCRLWARRASRRVLPSAAFSGEVGGGISVVAGLGDRRDVEDAVDASVASVVEPVFDGIAGSCGAR